MNKALSIIKKLIKEAGEKNLSVYAAGIAFFWILSAVPVLIVISCVVPYTSLTEEVLRGYVIGFLPETVEVYVTELVRYIFLRNKTVLPIALLVAVWSAGRGMLSLIRGLNAIHDITEKRGYIKLRLLASLYTVIMLFGILFTLLLLVFGQSIYELIFAQMPMLHDALHTILKLRYFLAVLFLSVLFTVLYTFVPDIDTSLRRQFPGGFLASLGCTVFSYCFSVYIDYFNDYSGYGSISMVVIVMLWLYFMIYIILYGAYLAGYLSDHNYKQKK